MAYRLLCCIAFASYCTVVGALHNAAYPPAMAPLANEPRTSSLFSFNGTWHVLGPFQIGTREASWGADPLEYVGGFRNLSYDPDATFRSSLPTNGTAKWNITEAVQVSSSSTSANASLSVSYSNVDWDFLKLVYGWAAVQYQAWARGELIIGGNETQHVVLYTDAILEYWVDDQHYFGGDFYTFRKAPPVLHLTPGSHKIDIRLVRDVRAFGGILQPTIDVALDIQQASGTLELAKPGILVSDIVNGTIVSSVGSVSLVNSGEDDIEIVGIRTSSVSLPFSFSRVDVGHQIYVEGDMEVLTDKETSHPPTNSSETSIIIVAGQTRPVAMNIMHPSQNASKIGYNITYRPINSTKQSTLQVYQDLNHSSMYRPHKLTFLHPSGVVSYAMIRPPAENATCRSGQRKLPVLLSLHGAGVEVDQNAANGVLDPVSDLCAWVLFPTGVTAWSSDDWHNWGFADVEAAIEAIPAWIERIGWTGPGVDINRWIVAGHSNGGQGTWYALTHRPDKILAAAPISGYASIQKYVPYELWQPADPRRIAVLSASLNSYRHEILMSNVYGIPIQQQHGQVDDNVPAFNSRFLAQQLYLAGASSNYNEVPGQNHWWEYAVCSNLEERCANSEFSSSTVMTTPQLVDFYYTQTRNEDVLPRKLHEFTLVVGDPGDMGSKGGIRVLQLHDPGQYGKVKVKGHVIETTNVMSLAFDPILWKDTVTINGIPIDSTELDAPISLDATGIKEPSGTVRRETTTAQRNGRQLGSMTAILRTQGPFVIRHPGTADTCRVALQISRNMHQYFQADAAIFSSVSDSSIANTSGNIITLALNTTIPDTLADFPIQVGKLGCSVVDHQGRKQEYGPVAQGAAFLRPAGGERLELVIWGADEVGLQQAARITPMMTGVGQPDFVVFGKSAQWRGVEGILAMGFFDGSWKVTASSVVETGGAYIEDSLWNDV